MLARCHSPKLTRYLHHLDYQPAFLRRSCLCDTPPLPLTIAFSLLSYITTTPLLSTPYADNAEAIATWNGKRSLLTPGRRQRQRQRQRQPLSTFQKPYIHTEIQDGLNAREGGSSSQCGCCKEPRARNQNTARRARQCLRQRQRRTSRTLTQRYCRNRRGEAHTVVHWEY
jgi:hypothetical protein